MKTAVVGLESLSPYCPAWMLHAPAHPNGQFYIRGTHLSRAILTTVREFGTEFGDKRARTRVGQRVYCPGPINLWHPAPDMAMDARPIFINDIEYLEYPDNKYVKSERYPIIPQWLGTALIDVFFDTITDVMLSRYLDMCGRRIGLGHWRPEFSDGRYGTFKVTTFECEIQSS